MDLTALEFLLVGIIVTLIRYEHSPTTARTVLILNNNSLCVQL
jgi:hypothetical protein